MARDRSFQRKIKTSQGKGRQGEGPSQERAGGSRYLGRGLDPLLEGGSSDHHNQGAARIQNQITRSEEQAGAQGLWLLLTAQW